MNLRRFIFLWFTLISVLLLAACGGGGDDDNENTTSNNDEQTTAVQPTTASTTQRSEVTYTYEDGATITLTIPSGWVADTSDGIVLANSEEALNAEETALTAGQVRGTLDFIRDDSQELTDLGMRNTSRPIDIVTSSIDALASDTRTYTVAAPRAFLVSGTTGGMTNGTVTIDGTIMDVIVAAIDKRAGFGRLFFVAPEGEIGQYEGAIRNIAASITFTAPEGE